MVSKTPKEKLDINNLLNSVFGVLNLISYIAFIILLWKTAKNNWTVINYDSKNLEEMTMMKFDFIFLNIIPLITLVYSILFLLSKYLSKSRLSHNIEKIVAISPWIYLIIYITYLQVFIFSDK